MRGILISCSIVWFVLSSSFIARLDQVDAQTITDLQCGDAIDSFFSEQNEVHEYSIDLTEGARLIIFAEETGNAYQHLRIDIGLTAPGGHVIDPLQEPAGGDYQSVVNFWRNILPTSTVDSDLVAESGPYNIRIRGYTDTGSSYSLYVSCVFPDGTVRSANNQVQRAFCGSIIENHFTRHNEVHRYYLVLSEGDQALLSAVSGANAYETLVLDAGIMAPGGHVIDPLQEPAGGDYQSVVNFWHLKDSVTLETGAVAESGIYRISIRGYTDTGSPYTFSIGCTLADGTRVKPGDAPPVPTPESGPTGPNDSSTQVFSGEGFPGLPPVDFSNVARLPLIEGVPMTGAISPAGGEVLGFVFTANEGDVFDLSYTRASGNLNLGLVVLSEDNKVLFQTSLVLSETVSTRFTIPSAGEYTVGVFRIDLVPPTNPEPTAFQVKVDLNP